MKTENTPKVESINQHPFVLSLLKKTKILTLQDESVLSELELYQKKILFSCVDISDILDTMELSMKFSTSVIGQTDHQIVGKGIYLNYHLDFFVLKLGAFKDLLYKLINNTYRFGYKENSRLHWCIIKEAERTPSISTIIDPLNTLFESIIELRNKVAHGTSVNDSKLSIIKAEDLLNELNGKTKESMDEEKYNAILESAVFSQFFFMYSAISSFKLYLIHNAYEQLYEIRKPIETELAAAYFKEK